MQKTQEGGLCNSLYPMIPFLNYVHIHEGLAHRGCHVGVLCIVHQWVCKSAHAQEHAPGQGSVTEPAGTLVLTEADVIPMA